LDYCQTVVSMYSQILILWLLVPLIFGLDKYLIDFPEPNTAHNRIFIQILHFDLHHMDSLELNLNEYLSMCEAGWNPSILIHTCGNYTNTVLKYIMDRTFCYRTKSFLPIKIRQYDSDIGVWLAAPHRLVAKEHINDFDFFIYMEDDMIFRYTMLTAFLHETKILQRVLPENGLADYCIGFQRFKRSHHAKKEYVDGDNVVAEYLEELPKFDHICMNDEPYVVCHEREDGVHQAIWSLTKQQLLTLQDRCNYLNLFTGQRYVCIRGNKVVLYMDIDKRVYSIVSAKDTYKI
jgi:hypothetical protein